MSDEADLPGPQDGWTILRAGGQASTALEIPTKPSGVVGAQGPVRLALGRNGGARLLLPLGPTEDARLVAEAPALAAEVSIYAEGGQPTRFLDLTCKVMELEAVFARVAEQILARIASGVGSVEAARSTIEEFRSLLVRPPASEITTSMIAGLVGELLVLKRLLDRSPDGWRAWRGPVGARHDFTMSSAALEVKVTLGKGSTAITVNGLEQLSEPAGGKLFLQHFELEAAGAGMFSVSSLGRAVLANAGEPNRVRELLSAVGCEDVNDDAWNTTGFRLENETLYKVGPGFPRLVPSSFPGGVVPAGISDVHYVADLSSAAATCQIEPARLGDIEELLVS